MLSEADYIFWWRLFTCVCVSFPAKTENHWIVEIYVIMVDPRDDYTLVASNLEPLTLTLTMYLNRTTPTPMQRSKRYEGQSISLTTWCQEGRLPLCSVLA